MKTFEVSRFDATKMGKIGNLQNLLDGLLPKDLVSWDLTMKDGLGRLSLHFHVSVDHVAVRSLAEAMGEPDCYTQEQADELFGESDQ